MRSAVHAHMLKLAEKSGPIGSILKAATHKGHVDTDEAKNLLVEAGYVVIVTKGNTETSAWVRVWQPCECHPAEGELRAQGFSGLGKDDAMLAALYGAAREENARITIDEELASIPEAVRTKVKADPHAMLQLERGFITEGLPTLRRMLGKE